jgi:hypothetical protein
MARSIPKKERIDIDRYIGRYQYRRYIEYRFFAIPNGDSDAIRRKILSLLGTRFGFYDDCSKEEVTDLPRQLTALSLQQDDQPSNQRQSTLPQQEVLHTDNDRSQDSVGKSHCPGKQAHAHHKEKVERLVSQVLTELHAVPPEVQFDVMNHQIKALQELLHGAEQAANAEQQANFKKGQSVSFARKEDPIERNNDRAGSRSKNKSCE